jgi:hypothetical protein
MAEMAQGAAWLVRPGDESTLADALGQVLEGGKGAPDVARRRELGLTRAAEFTWSASVATHVKAFRVALGTSQ